MTDPYEGPEGIEEPEDLAKLLDAGLWHDCTRLQRETVVNAWNHDSLIFTRKLTNVMAAENPTARLVWQSRRILAGPKRTSQGAVVRRPHDQPECRLCGDTGFVILNRDQDDGAVAGDAAPCVCPLGRAKMSRYGVVNYGPGDFTPTIPDDGDMEGRISLVDYMNSPAGKADPYLPALLKLMRKEEGESASG